MLLATRCPFCETVFRLQPAQLAQRRGLVRCGHCHEVFDASSSLFDITEGGDFSTAKPVAAAAAIEALSGVRQKDPDFSAEGWNPWAPTPDAAIDNRLLHNAGNACFADADLHRRGRRAHARPRRRAGSLPAGAFAILLCLPTTNRCWLTRRSNPLPINPRPGRRWKSRRRFGTRPNAIPNPLWTKRRGQGAASPITNCVLARPA